LIKNLKGYIYLDKGYHKSVSEKIYVEVKKNNGIIVSLDEEGGVDYSDGSTLLGRYSKTLFENVDLTFLWGYKQYELVKNNMNKDSKVVVTGHPRFELLKPEFHYLYQDEVDDIKKRFNNFILINTNMGFGNNIRGDEFVVSNYGSRFKNIDQIIAFDKKKLEAYRLLVLELSRLLNKTIVLRPHPEEDHSFYFDAFKGRKNIHVVYEGSVVPWLKAADLMIHPDCTTAIEALILGRKPISYLPSESKQSVVTKLPVMVSHKLAELEGVEALLSDLTNISKNITQSDTDLLEDYFTLSADSTKLICDELVNTTKQMDRVGSGQLGIGDRLYLKYRDYKQRNSNSENAALIHSKLNGFDSSEVRRLCGKFSEIHPDLNRVQISQISPRLFRFSSEQS